MHKLRLGVRYDRGQWFVSVVEIMSGHCVYGDNSSPLTFEGPGKTVKIFGVAACHVYTPDSQKEAKSRFLLFS